jgi:hypothetical protein
MFKNSKWVCGCLQPHNGTKPCLGSSFEKHGIILQLARHLLVAPARLAANRASLLKFSFLTIFACPDAGTNLPGGEIATSVRS